MSEPIHIPGAIHIPAGWEIDEIPTVRGKLFRQTGCRRFGTEILAATLSGELPADGCMGLLKGSGGNLENARALGRRASVDWDDIAEWLRAKGYDVRRGRWIEFDEALAQLQKRIAPAPTAAELESWIGLCGLQAYIDSDSRQRYLFDSFLYLRNAELPERRLRLWLDSEEVAAFEPPCRWLTFRQLCERWQVDEPKVHARLKQGSGIISCHNLESFEDVTALECVESLESEHPDWLKFDAFHPDRQLFPWLDLRDRERHDAQRLAELMRSDPAGELARLRAAKALGIERLSCWLEPRRIAQLYGDPLVDEHVTHATFAGMLPGRGVCTGLAIHVDDFVRWTGMPPTPEGSAGDSVRAWLSLATAEPEPEPERMMMAAPTPETEQKADSLIQQRVEIIAAELSRDHADLMALPRGSKAELRSQLCREMPRLFTESTFDKAWTDGTSGENPRFRLVNADKHRPTPK